MKKKALACLLAAVMALSLAACGSGSDNKKTSEKTESQDTNTSLEATNQLIEAEDPSALPETAAKMTKERSLTVQPACQFLMTVKFTHTS